MLTSSVFLIGSIQHQTMASHTQMPTVLTLNKSPDSDPAIAPADSDRNSPLPSNVAIDSGWPVTSADDLDEPTLYRYCTDRLKEDDIIWIKDHVKIYGTLDVVDNPNNGTHPGARPASCQVSLPPHRPLQQVGTDAFGQICFTGEDMPGWFIHMASDIKAEILQELFEKRLELLTSQSQKPVCIHFIDYDHSTWPKMEKKPEKWWRFPAGIGRHRGNKQEDNIQMKSLNEISERMYRDIRSICRRTPGLVMTWSGLKEGPGQYIHVALKKLFEESIEDTSNLASISFPPWRLLPDDIKEAMKRQVSERHQDGCAFQLKRSEDGLGSSVSTAATHFLLLDQSHQAESPGMPFSDELATQLRDCRHFQYSLIKAVDKYKGSKEMPIMCILIGGGPDSLKMVKFALDSNIPVLILKGTGGAADALADVYIKAASTSTKERDGKERVRTRSKKLPGEAGQEYINLFKDSATSAQRDLESIFERLDRLTVYCPTLTVQSLDSVIFEALFKNNQKERINWLAKIMKCMKKTHDTTASHTAFIDSVALQMDIFIEAVKQNPDNVTVFLDTLQTSFKDFHLGRVLRLYSEDTGESLRMIDIRRDLQKHLKKLTVFPLRCLCEQCYSCSVETNTKSPEAELTTRKTCLHPMQELFLWAVQVCHTDLAVKFWKKCDDKMAAALVAQAVFRSMAKSEKDFDKRWQKEEDMKRFEQLAINTLKSCHDMDETETESLLTKPCPWWGGVSILQLAIMTRNKAFIAQSACKNVMTRIWRGDPPASTESDSGGSKDGPAHLVDIKPEAGCGNWACFPPRWKYCVNLVLQVVFLMLFSYTLLSDFGRTLTPAFNTLIIWVASITVEEIRQFVDWNPVSREVRLAQKQLSFSFKRKWKAYWSQVWNRLDFATVGLFWLGMLAFADNIGVHRFGRILLSIDVFFFFIRTFQMLMVFEELGLLLVMVYKMVKDTVNFMIVLLIFVVAYAVASEAILYPESEITLARLFHLPRKAYWQVFGELLLEEIEPAGQGDCISGNTSMHFGGDTPHCPTSYGRYVVPILLGLYIVITHVLLLNLLIARFNVTFNKVHDEAVEYQSWHRCEIITEFYSRTSLPPPFNILHFVLRACRWLVQTFCCFCSSYCKRRRDGGRCERTTDWGDAAQRLLAVADGNVVCLRSADGRSIDIFWNKSLPSKNGVYTVHVKDGSHPNESVSLAEFTVAENKLALHAVSVWDLDPSKSYWIAVENVQASEKQDTTTTHSSESLCKIRQFEEDQALWVLRHENVDENPVLRELRESSTSIKNDLTQLGKHLEERIVSQKTNEMRDLRVQMQNLSRDLEQYESSVSTLPAHFNKFRGNINANMKQIANYIDDRLEEQKKAFIKQLDEVNAQLGIATSGASLAASWMEELKQVVMESRSQARAVESQMEEMKQMLVQMMEQQKKQQQ